MKKISDMHLVQRLRILEKLAKKYKTTTNEYGRIYSDIAYITRELDSRNGRKTW